MGDTFSLTLIFLSYGLFQDEIIITLKWENKTSHLLDKIRQVLCYSLFAANFTHNIGDIDENGKTIQKHYTIQLRLVGTMNANILKTVLECGFTSTFDFNQHQSKYDYKNFTFCRENDDEFAPYIIPILTGDIIPFFSPCIIFLDLALMAIQFFYFRYLNQNDIQKLEAKLGVLRQTSFLSLLNDHQLSETKPQIQPPKNFTSQSVNKTSLKLVRF